MKSTNSIGKKSMRGPPIPDGFVPRHDEVRASL